MTIMLQLKLPDLKKIESIAQKNSECISFSQGALKIGGTPNVIKEYVRDILISDSADYYQHVLGIRQLREALATHLSQLHNITLTPDHIMVSHGSIGALTSLCLTVLSTNDEVVLPNPFYPVYENVIRLAKATPVHSAAYYQSTCDGHWHLDISRLISACTPSTKMIILSNPSNPLGACLSPQELQELVMHAERHGIYLVVDEVYDAFVYEGSFTSATPYVLQSPYVIRLGSFSKNFGMSGWRVGYMVASPSLYETIAPIQDAVLCCATVPSQYAALAALTYPHLMLEGRTVVQKSRDIAVAHLTTLANNGIITFAPPRAGFFIFFKTHTKNTTELVMEILTREKVSLVPGIDFGQDYGAYIRLCFARRPEIVQEGLTRILRYFGFENVCNTMHSSKMVSLPEGTSVIPPLG
jgi:aspartate/methionine/tyrosine aminotransferase